ncbi:hypothetical protein Q1695_005505 [Nippostrongylus brasiliensis]|nr:hypothetical protein Q1695_005505 [Nippostrongylus brasiliensis]
MDPVVLSTAEKHFIAHGLADNLRNDGRGCEDFRPFWIESPALCTTNGSARVKIDTTDILVGVKCEVVECEDTSLLPNRLQFTVDPSCLASARTEARGGEYFTEAVAAVLEEAYHGSGDVITNMNRLILSKQFMWKVYVDVVIQQYGGNIIDAVFVAVKAALLDTRITVLALVPQDGGKFNIECDESTETNFFKLEAENAPLCRTTDDQIRLRLVKQMDPGGMDPRSIPAMIDMALRVGRNLHSAVNTRLEEIRNDDGSHVAGSSFLYE